MKIWKKIILGFIAVIPIMIAVDYYSIRNSIQVIKLINELEISQRVELNQSNKSAYIVQLINLNMKELFLEIEDSEEPNEIIRARKIIEGSLPTLLNSISTLTEATIKGNQFASEEESELGELEELVLIDSLSVMVSRFELSIQKTLSLIDENKYSLADAMFENNTEDISGNIQDILLILAMDAEEEVYSSIKQLDGMVNRTIVRGIFMTILSVILALSIGIYISRSISAGISKLIDGTNELSKGKLETHVSINTNDELELLSHSFNNMAKELKEKIAAIDNLNNNLVESNHTKDTFFSIIGHDLKSPVNGILGFSELLSKKYYKYDDAKRIMFINQIYKSSRVTCELLDNLLTWARSQSGKIQINKENVNLHTLIEKSKEIYQGNAINKDIKIVNDIPVSTSIIADVFTLTVAINNTINNALKFTSNGGVITITTKAYSDSVELCIKDTGVGMSQETIDNLIQNKKTTSTLGTKDEAGTGLGLILIKDFISKNDGQLSIKSEIGKGSEFRFLLPLTHDVHENKI